MKPNCCGKEAEWIVQSVRLAYWFCRECKNEVSYKPVSASALERSDMPISQVMGGKLVWDPAGAIIPRGGFPNTGMLLPGDLLVFDYDDGSTYCIAISARHVKTIPSSVVKARVNGNLVYDKASYYGFNGAPTPAAQTHQWNRATASCNGCGMSYIDWSQGAGSKWCSGSTKAAP
jgi:hypothetical protein